MKYQSLFDPINIGSVQIKNRFFMAPMAPFGMTDDDGSFNQKAIEYYVARAKGGVGLIVTGVTKVETTVEKMIRPGFAILDINNVAFIQHSREMTERVHAYGTKIFLQIGLGFGRAMLPFAIQNGAGRIAPSKIDNRWDSSIEHDALTIEEIEILRDKTIEAAQVAKICGFDGVEIHAVHEGYLLDQFTMDLFNHRTDKYGGSFENRYRLPVEIVQGIKNTCGQDFPVALRYSVKSYIKDIRQGALPKEEFKELGRDLSEGLKAAQHLEKAGYDAFDMDAGCYDSWYWNHPPMYFQPGMYLKLAEHLKDVVKVPVLTAGRMDDPDLAIKALAHNQSDMIGLGRPLLADPNLVNKIKYNQVQQIRPCLSCQDGCIGRLAKGFPMSCAVNPSCGREAIYAIQPALKTKNILVVGGGVAGLEYARVSAIKGHHVILHEKTAHLGGALIPGGMAPFKRYDHKLIAWYKQEMKRLEIDVHINSTISKDYIDAHHFDEVVIATGGKPIKLALKGREKNHCLEAIEVLNNTNLAKDKIVIIGAGLVGGELGLWLAQQGKKVTLVEMTDEILGEKELCFANYDMLKDLLAQEKVTILTHTKATAVDEKGLIITRADGTLETVLADTIIEAVGYTSHNQLAEQLAYENFPVKVIGDARHVDNIMNAIWEAYEVAH